MAIAPAPDGVRVALTNAEGRFVLARTSGPLSQDVGPIDPLLQRGRTARSTGHVFDALNNPTMAGSLLLVPALATGVTCAPLGARIERDGAFEFPNVSPGRIAWS